MARFYTDFSEYPIGQAPEGWTKRWDESTWLVTADRVLEHTITNSGVSALSWDNAGIVANVEVVAKARVVSGAGGRLYFIVRGGDDYGYSVYHNNAEFRIWKTVGGSGSTLDSIALPLTFGVWYWYRLQVSGNAIKAKFWEHGQSEPHEWTLETTDNNLTSGWVGAGDYFGSSGGKSEFDVFSVGTAGDGALKHPYPLIPPHRQIHADLQISRPDGETWFDATSYLTRAEVELGDVSSIGTGSTGVDGRVRTLNFSLINDGAMMPCWDENVSRGEAEIVGTDETIVGDAEEGAEAFFNLLFDTQHNYARINFSPRDRNSPVNVFGGNYNPLLWPMREVIFRVAITPPNVPPIAADWKTLFHGVLGDRIFVNPDSGKVECECRDLAKLLLDTYIEEEREYGSEQGTSAENVIQAILDDNLGANAPTLYCPISPGFMIWPYKCEYKSVWDAIQEIASQIGWFLGYRWDDVANQFRLTLMEPPREKDATTADFYLGWEDDFYVNDVEIADADIRNVVKVAYHDKNLGIVRSVTKTDPTSIAEYGRKAMQIEEGDTSLIDTYQEAETFAQAAIDDLKDLPALASIDMPLLPETDVYSGIVVHDPRVSSTDDFYGVHSVRHTLDFEGDRFRTEVVAAGRVIGSCRRWLAMQTRPGAKEPIKGKDIKERNYEVFVAAEDGPSAVKALANYVCSGESVQNIINQAFEDLPLTVANSGTAQAGGASSITLAANASEENGEYVSLEVKITGGTGEGQTRQIVAYNGVTKVAEVDSAWLTQPDNTSEYEVLTRAGTVILARGKYPVTGPILIPANCTLAGHGAGATTLVVSTSSSENFSLVANKNPDIGNPKINVSDLTLDGNKANLTEGIKINGIEFSRVFGGGISKCKAINMKGAWPYYHFPDKGSGFVLYLCDDYKIIDCIADGNDSPGVSLFNSAGVEVRGNICQYSKYGDGVYGEANSGVIIATNIFRGNLNHGIFVDGLLNSTISQNVLEYNDLKGIYLAGGMGCTVTGNTATENEVGILLVGGSGNVISENTCTDSLVYSGIIISYGSVKNNVQSNVCRGNYDYGIRIHDSAGDLNLVANNDCIDGGNIAGIKNENVTTQFGNGNRLKDGTWSVTPDG